MRKALMGKRNTILKMIKNVALGRGWINLAQNLWVLEERVITFLVP
jgi:hypothetical protein